ncbi:MAG: glycerophosphodiester phosphodiesterase family protein [Prolixibacteraceae bacterium]|jgi:glycerophosphoryl diester phosphodiesterase|nr:glycerophosphodiester phosphodiesterase family protein [Prolixibacteraceae bacterium]
MKKNTLYLIGVLTLVVLVMSCSFNKNNRPSHQDTTIKNAATIQVVSHRGANQLAPENTYASAKKAIESGAHYVEVDVRRSKDGVYYNFHDRTLNRTTNGSGVLSETGSAVIDTLDAGSWFAHEYAGERVPRVFEFLQWIKGKAKVYFDLKDVRLEEFIPEIYKIGMENDCFFRLSNRQLLQEFRNKYPGLAIKMKASSVEALDSLQTIYNPQVIECSVNNLSDDLIRECHKRGMKIMPYMTGNDWKAYRIALSKDVDMVFVDSPDVFSDMAKNGGVFKGYKLIAHRGGIVEGKYNAFDPASVQEAIDQGYYMLEVDVRPTKDGVIILNHDSDFSDIYNVPRRVADMTWEEIQKLRPVNGKDYHPLSFEELCQMCSGKVKLMIDVKGNQAPEFYFQLGKIMEKYGLLTSSYFIDKKGKNYLWGKAKFSVRANEVDSLKAKLGKGEDIACHYFLFENGNRLASEAIKWCQQHYVTVVPTVNIWQYQSEDYRRGANRDIEFFKECGVTEFQIDSDFDEWFFAEK